MKNFKYLLLVFSLIGLFGCSKEADEIENEEVVIPATSDQYRLMKVLNYSSSTDPEPYSFMDLEYDANGNVCKESLYDYPGTLFTYREYTYENNILKEKKNYDGAVGNLKLGTYIKYAYENENLVKEELFLSGDILKSTIYYEYTGKNLVNTYTVNDELGIHHRTKYTYNNFNLVILEESYMYNQVLDEFTKYHYDDQLRLVKTEICNADGSIIQTQEKKYIGSRTLPTEILFYGANDVFAWKYEYQYDDLNNLTEIRTMDGLDTHTLEKNKYDGKLLIEHIQYIPSFGYAEWFVNRYEYLKIR